MAKKAAVLKVIKLAGSGKEVPVHCAHTNIVAPSKLVPHPENPNTHPKYQVDVLAKVIVAQGWRAPITVSRRSGFIVRGHCRLKAAIQAGFSKVPVDYQDYADADAEWADLVADNRIAELAEIDMDILKKGFETLESNTFDMELTGFSSIELDKLINGGDYTPANDPNEEWDGMPEFGQEEKRPHRSLIVHFRSQEDVDTFSKLIAQGVSDKAKYIWHPKQDIDHVADMRWASSDE